MSWRESLLNTLGPGAFGGITFGRWLRVLRDNRFRVEPPYWPRALVITSGSILNTALGSCENLVYARRIRATQIEPPLFVLGIFRSGTTHLQNLLAQDDRFATPNLIQATFPSTFLCAESLYRAFATFFLPAKRPQDAVALSPLGPHEDEWAICNLTGRSFVADLSFPRRADYYRRYFTFEGLSTRERDEWTAALQWFLRKLSLKHGRPLVLKSPGHTCRIKTLLELFPDAKFIHVRRDPFVVFQSWQHMVRRVSPQMELQRPDHSELPETIIRMYKRVYDAYFDQRRLIPEGHLHEMSFEALEAEPLEELRMAYRALNLPSYEDAEGAYRRYVSSLATYEKNQYPPLSEQWRQRIADEWQPFFERWGYAAS